MATTRILKCPSCKEEKKGSGYLYEDLSMIADNTHKCEKCQENLLLFITFNFGLDAGECQFLIKDVFYPENLEDNTWQDENDSEVIYCPFLVIMSNVDKEDEQSFWFPYWHEVKTVQGECNYKYGQWAPVIEKKTFNSLVNQAKAKGYEI